jgi:regulator of protease activity HflC (stomatin/prohibitin superfamily)
MPHIRWRLFLILVSVIALLVILKQSFLIVQAGERAVIFSKVGGMKPYQLSEGFHFNLPLVWIPTKYDIKTLTYTMSGGGNEAHGETRNGAQEMGDGQVPDDSLEALTSDGLPLMVDVSIRFHIDPENVWRLHRFIGPDFVDKVVRPEARSVARAAFAEFPVIDVYSGKRQAIVEQIQSELRDKLRRNFLILDEVLLRKVSFSDAFQSAIIQKQIAQQNAQRMQYVLEKQQREKQRQIILAEGEAEAIRLKGQAIATNPNVLAYEYVQKVAPNIRGIITNGGSVPMPTVQAARK